MTDTERLAQSPRPDPAVRSDHLNEPDTLDSRGAVVRRRWPLVAIIAIVVGAATYGVSTLVPASYKSSATVSVDLFGAGVGNQTIGAANDLAGQYAQVVKAEAVLRSASQRLNESASALRVNVSGGTVADQNVVQVTASGQSPQAAERRAEAVARAFIAYIRDRAAAQSKAFSRQTLLRLRPLDDQIRRLTRQLATFETIEEQRSGRFVALQQTLSTAVAQRSSAISESARSSGDPTVTLLNPAHAGQQVQPKPVLYAVVAFVVALVVASQFVVYLTPKRS